MGPSFLISLVLLTSHVAMAMRYQCRKDVPCGCGQTNVQTEGRIIQGEDARPYSWPMIVSLRAKNNNRHYCGGSILSESFILTAAHCVDAFSSGAKAGIKIVAGIHFLAEKTPLIPEVDQIYIHPNWTGALGNVQNDIALIRLSRPLNFTNNPFIARTCLPQPDRSKNLTEYPPSATNLVAIGWGLQSPTAFEPPQVLQQVTLQAIHHTHPTCTTAISNSLLQICTGIINGTKGNSAINHHSRRTVSFQVPVSVSHWRSSNIFRSWTDRSRGFGWAHFSMDRGSMATGGRHLVWQRRRLWRLQLSECLRSTGLVSRLDLFYHVTAQSTVDRTANARLFIDPTIDLQLQSNCGHLRLQFCASSVFLTENHRW